MKIKETNCFLILLIFLVCYIIFEPPYPIVHGETNSILNSSDLIVKFYEMGDGDCTFIKYGNLDILIDGGENKGKLDHVKNEFQKNITDGILEYMFVSHGDSDHIRNIIDLFPYFNPTSADCLETSKGKKYYIDTLIDFDTKVAKNIYKTDIYNKYVEKRNNMINQQNDKNKGIRNYYPADQIWENQYNKGTKTVILKHNDLEIHILYNKYYFEQTKESNMISLCLLLKYGDSKVLFTGDLEEKDTYNDKFLAGETNLVEYYKDTDLLTNVTLFKAGHHGSRSSNSKVLMDVIKPKHVMITCEAGGKKYNFPKQESLDNFFTYTDYIYISSEYLPGTNNSKEGATISYYGDVTFTITKTEKVNVDISNTNLKKDGKIVPLQETKWFKNSRTSSIKTYVFSGYQSNKKAYVGNCTLVKYGHYDIVIDCGLSCIGTVEAIIQDNFIEDLKKYVIDGVIEYLIVTTPNSESISQLVDIIYHNEVYKKGVINTFKIKNLIDFGDVKDPSQGAPISLYKQYKELRNNLSNSDETDVKAVVDIINSVDICEGMRLNVLKNEYYEDKRTPNNASVAITIQFFDKELLFMGCMQKNGEEGIVKGNDLSKIAFFLCNDNGSSSSNSQELLNVLNKNVYICSNSIVGYKRNGVVLFNKKVSDRLLNKSVNVYVTMKNDENGIEELSGDIVFILNSRGVCSLENTEAKTLKETKYYEK